MNIPSIAFTTITEDAEDILAIVGEIVPTDGRLEDLDVTIKISGWYGDPMIRDLEVSAALMGIPVMMEAKGRWGVK